jgi:hypothetical protein
VAAVLLHTDVELLGVGRLGNELPLDTAKILGIQAEAVETLPALAGTGIEKRLLGIFLDVLETGNHPRIEDRIGAFARRCLTAHGPLLLASGQPRPHHCQSVPAHIDYGDDYGDATLLSGVQETLLHSPEME